MQALLPTFGPRVLNSMLVVKQALDSTPGADKMMDRIFNLPMGLLMKMFGAKVGTESSSKDDDGFFLKLELLHF